MAMIRPQNNPSSMFQLKLIEILGKGFKTRYTGESHVRNTNYIPSNFSDDIEISRYAYNVLEPEVEYFVTIAVLSLPTESIFTFAETMRNAIDFYRITLMDFMKSDASKMVCLNAIMHCCLTNPEIMKVPQTAAFIIYYFQCREILNLQSVLTFLDQQEQAWSPLMELESIQMLHDWVKQQAQRQDGNVLLRYDGVRREDEPPFNPVHLWDEIYCQYRVLKNFDDLIINPWEIPQDYYEYEEEDFQMQLIEILEKGFEDGQGFDEDDCRTTIFADIEMLIYANKIVQPDIEYFVTLAVLSLPCLEDLSIFAFTVRNVINFYQIILRHYIKSDTSKMVCLNAIMDCCLSSSHIMKVSQAAAFIIYHFQEADVLTLQCVLTFLDQQEEANTPLVELNGIQMLHGWVKQEIQMEGDINPLRCYVWVRKDGEPPFHPLLLWGDMYCEYRELLLNTDGERFLQEEIPQEVEENEDEEIPQIDQGEEIFREGEQNRDAEQNEEEEIFQEGELNRGEEQNEEEELYQEGEPNRGEEQNEEEEIYQAVEQNSEEEQNEEEKILQKEFQLRILEVLGKGYEKGKGFLDEIQFEENNRLVSTNIKKLGHAYKIVQPKIEYFVTMAVLSLPCNQKPCALAFKLKHAISFYQVVLRKFIKSDASQMECLKAIMGFHLDLSRFMKVSYTIAFIIHFFTLTDVLTLQCVSTFFDQQEEKESPLMELESMQILQDWVKQEIETEGENNLLPNTSWVREEDKPLFFWNEMVDECGDLFLNIGVGPGEEQNYEEELSQEGEQNQGEYQNEEVEIFQRGEQNPGQEQNEAGEIFQGGELNLGEEQNKEKEIPHEGEQNQGDTQKKISQG